ncbi:MAG TPA: TIGR03067 domain-containing protein, partial [Isosphaeraceae bacterium]
MTIHAAAFAAILALAPADDKPALKGDVAKLQGTWTGKVGRANERTDVRVEFQGDSVTMTFGRDAQKRTGRGTLRLDDTAKPRALDLVDFRMSEDAPPRPSPPFIYELEGDSLKLCGAGDV